MTYDSPAQPSGDASALDEVPILIGRQAIYDRSLGVHAYELLYRNSMDHAATFQSGDVASSTVLSGAFVDLGLDVVTGGKPAFVNFTQALITSDLARLFPPDRIVAEVLEDVLPTEDVVGGVRSLKEAGYRIALDDFVFRDDLIPLVELADVIKLDVLELGMPGVEEQLAQLSRWDLELLAEKVETTEEYEACKALGFHYFQGYFLCRPQILESHRHRQNSVGLVQLLAALNDPEATIQDVENIITRDAKLAYRLLSYINSAIFSLTGHVDSVRHALGLLGKRTVRAWANLVVMCSVGGGHSAELLATALMRARMCEKLAPVLGLKHPDECFTVGLFSILDALLGMPMSRITSSLPLSHDVSVALAEQSGPMGDLLRSVIAYERDPDAEIEHAELDHTQVLLAFAESLEWVARVLPEKGN